jgi:endonuclease YncB( thermonuclease family)
MRFLVSLFLLALAPTTVLGWIAHTKTVHDGDSITVINADATHVVVRLYGIDAPERKQPFGYQATTRLKKLAARKDLDVEPMDTDRYGRTVALVRLKDGTLLNEVMVAEGLAWVYDDYCRSADLCERLRSLQQRARSEGRGLWSDDSPERPLDWRREHKTEEWYKAPVRALKTIVKKVRVVLKP